MLYAHKNNQAAFFFETDTIVTNAYAIILFEASNRFTAKFFYIINALRGGKNFGADLPNFFLDGKRKSFEIFQKGRLKGDIHLKVGLIERDIFFVFGFLH